MTTSLGKKPKLKNRDASLRPANVFKDPVLLPETANFHRSLKTSNPATLNKRNYTAPMAADAIECRLPNSGRLLVLLKMPGA
jgi:hypothetical protein